MVESCRKEMPRFGGASFFVPQNLNGSNAPLMHTLHLPPLEQCLQYLQFVQAVHVLPVPIGEHVAGSSLGSQHVLAFGVGPPESVAMANMARIVFMGPL